MIESLFGADLTGNIELVKGSFIIYTVTIDENSHYFCSYSLFVDILPLDIGECSIQAKATFTRVTQGCLDGPGWTPILGSWFLFLKISDISNLDRAIPNSCLSFLILDCSETPI